MLTYLCRKCHHKLLSVLGRQRSRPQRWSSSASVGRISIAGQRLRGLSVVFYGSDEFSLETLKLLNRDFAGQTTGDHSMEPLITRLDVVLSSELNVIARFAAQHRLTAHRFPYELPADTYDIGVVSSFGHLIPKRAISACRLGMLNIHGSLLPRWRGAAPVNYAVLNADAITGITVMRIKPKKFDVGDIVCQMEYRIPDRITAKELKHRLAPIGAQLLWKCLLDLDNHLNNAKPQPNEGITYAPKFDDTYGLIEWSTMTATDIDRRFRAFDGFIDVYTHWTDGTRVRLHDMVSPEVVSTLELDRLCGRREPSPGFVYYHKKRRIVCVKCAANTWSAFGSLAPKGHKQISAHQFNNGFIKRAVNPLVLGQQMT